MNDTLKGSVLAAKLNGLICLYVNELTVLLVTYLKLVGIDLMMGIDNTL